METIYAVEAGWWSDDGLVGWFALHRTVDGAKKAATEDAALYLPHDKNPIEWWTEDHSGREYVHGTIEVPDLSGTRGYNIYEITVKE